MMPARDRRVAVKISRLKRASALRALIVISALFSLTACTTTTSSSGSQAALRPQTTLIAPKTVTDNMIAEAVVSAAPAPAETAAPAPADSILSLADIQAAEAAAPAGDLIDAAACTRGLTGSLATATAGQILLANNNIEPGAADETGAAPVIMARPAPVMVPMAAPSAGTPESSAPATLNVKLGQTEALLVAAYQQAGRRYKAGGQTPATGFDAPGFTRWVYAQRGLNLPHDARKQAAAGRPVAKEDLRPGDLLVYRDPNSQNGADCHVGIYTGQGNFLHAAPKSGVVTETAAFGPQFAPYFVGGSRYYDDPKAAPLSDSQKMAAASSAVKLALSELGPNDKLDRSIVKSKPKAKSKKKK